MSSGLEGKTLGQYQLTERLGKGGMAEVYKAYQPSLDRFVAIKVLHAYFAEEQDFRNRFQREARAVARLRHTNIVQIYDFGAEGDIYYMAMEFLDGGTLKQRLRESVGFMPRTEVLRIVERVAMALDYAHARGIYHRDVKPANIMLTTDNQVILTDFGLAKMAEGSQYTRSGLSVGTPEYMAPEQGQGLPVDHRADVYSLGVVLYELLTGQLPYTADTPVAIIFKHIKDPLPLPRTINTELSESFERVVLKALAKSPDDRFQSAGELATALRQAMIDADEDLPTPPPSPMSETHIATPALPAPATLPVAPAEPSPVPATPVEQGVKRAVSRVAGADAQDDWDTIGQKMEERTRRTAAKWAGVEPEQDWETIGQRLGERIEGRVAEDAGKAAVSKAAAGKPGRGGKKWFVAGCLTSLAILACCIGLLLATGICRDKEPQVPVRTTEPQHTPAPPPQPEGRWQPYEGLGLTMRYPADWGN
ncbi:MAG: protein kinase, partial [Chloroflexi bacterium]|nr:protein kinase [Chloroflexota bacterium]